MTTKGGSKVSFLPQKSKNNKAKAKVNILRDSHKPFLTPNREFERQFGRLEAKKSSKNF
jgi:hypothetical protein